MLVRLLLAVIVGLIVTFVADLFFAHTLSVLIGLLCGILMFFGHPSDTAI